MTDINKEIEACRKRWLQAKKKGDEVMMGLWRRVGEKLKKQLDDRMKFKF